MLALIGFVGPLLSCDALDFAFKCHDLQVLHPGGLERQNTL
jgi:hypothetical protein